MSEPFDRALRAAARRSRPAGVCPDAAMLASYADSGLSEDERRFIEAHAADCAACLEHLALLGAVSLDREAPEPSRPWLAHWGWLVPVATAVLVVAVWIRLPEQKASQDVPATPAPASQAKAPVASEQERAAAASPSAERDGASNAAPQFADKVAEAAPSRTAQPADAKMDRLTPLERRDTARQKAASAPPAVASAPPAAPPVRAQEAGAEKAQVLLGGTTSKVTSPTAAAAAAPRAADDAVKEEVRLAESGRRRESALQKTASSLDATRIVSASPKEAYRARGGQIELSEDGGTNWRAVLTDGRATFTAAGCSAGGPCWFGSADGQLLRRTPDGFSRSALPIRQRIVAIAPDGPQTVVVTVEGGQRFRTTDGGASWAPIP